MHILSLALSCIEHNVLNIGYYYFISSNVLVLILIIFSIFLTFMKKTPRFRFKSNIIFISLISDGRRFDLI